MAGRQTRSHAAKEVARIVNDVKDDSNDDLLLRAKGDMMQAINFSA